MRSLLFAAALNVATVHAHWGLFSPRPDFGKTAWEDCQSPADALIGNGDCNWFAMRGAYWFNAGTQIGCKTVTGCPCEPPHQCCDTLMEPTNTDPDLLTFPTWRNLSARVPFPYNLLTTEEAWLSAADAASDKGNHIYFRGDSERAPISKYNPWNAPGFAPVMDACGIHGGYAWPRREMFACGFRAPGATDEAGDCMESGPINGYTVDARSRIFDAYPRGMEYPPGTSGTAVINRFLETGAGEQPLTRWTAGGTAEVSQGYWESNHGGGYQYRLCPVEEFGTDADKNEACFQRTPLDYASATSWVEYGAHEARHGHGKGQQTKKANLTRVAIPAVRVTDANTKGVKPAGSVWTKMQIPTCLDSLCTTGVYAFKPPVPGLFSGGNWFAPAIIQLSEIFPDTVGKGDFTSLTAEQRAAVRDKYNAHADYVIVDRVRVPAGLAPGRYVLSWRWDAEHSAQVWTNCAVIEVVAPGDGEQAQSQSRPQSRPQSQPPQSQPPQSSVPKLSAEVAVAERETGVPVDAGGRDRQGLGVLLVSAGAAVAALLVLVVAVSRSRAFRPLAAEVAPPAPAVPTTMAASL